MCWPRLQRACARAPAFVVTASYAARVPEKSDGYFSRPRGRRRPAVVLCKSVLQENGPSLQVNDELAARWSVSECYATVSRAPRRWTLLRPAPPCHRILFAAISAAWIIAFCASVTSAKCRFCWPLQRSDSLDWLHLDLLPPGLLNFPLCICTVSNCFFFFFFPSSKSTTCDTLTAVDLLLNPWDELLISKPVKDVAVWLHRS